jgi:carboxyl-terminal processing protease
MRLSLLTLALSATFALPVFAQDASTLARQAQDAYAAKDYARSVELYTAAAAAGANTGGVYYNAACSAALAGRGDAAFGFLRKAVDAGWANGAHMAKDTDLTSLHADPRWQTLTRDIERIATQRERMWNNPALTSAWDAPLTEDQRVAGLSRAWSEAKYNFVNFDLVPDLDWDALYLQTLPRVRAATTNEAYYREIQAFYARLNDGHTSVFPSTDAADAWATRPGINTVWLEGHVIVRDVFDPALQATGLAPGWEIVGVEGKPVRDFARDAVVPYIAASTPQDRESRMYERFLLTGPIAVPARVQVRDLQGRTHELAMPRMTAKPRSALLPNTAPFEFRMLPGNIAWVALRSFGDDTAAKEYLAHFPQIAKADAIVFDLRDNGGGNSGVGYKVLATLTDKPFRTSAWSTREYVPTYRAWQQGEQAHREAASEVAADGERRYDKPVYVLTSARTYSAAEDFAVAFDAMQRGRIVGEPTGGSTGQPLIVSLPGGISARICTKRDTYPDGREFVGVGVQPQVLVRPTVADFRAGRDTVLEAALELARGDGRG